MTQSKVGNKEGVVQRAHGQRLIFDPRNSSSKSRMHVLLMLSRCAALCASKLKPPRPCTSCVPVLKVCYIGDLLQSLCSHNPRRVYLQPNNKRSLTAPSIGASQLDAFNLGFFVSLEPGSRGTCA
eukprot:scaffold100739_cov17-Tisochrysis_lutea.AAC.1